MEFLVLGARTTTKQLWVMSWRSLTTNPTVSSRCEGRQRAKPRIRPMDRKQPC